VKFNPSPLGILHTEYYENKKKRVKLFDYQHRLNIRADRPKFFQFKNSDLNYAIEKYLKSDEGLMEILKTSPHRTDRREYLCLDIKWQCFRNHTQTSCISGYHLDTIDDFKKRPKVYREEYHHIFAITTALDEKAMMTEFSTLPWDIDMEEVLKFDSMKSAFELLNCGDFLGQDPTFTLPSKALESGNEGRNKLIYDTLVDFNRKNFRQTLPQGTWLTYGATNFHRGGSFNSESQFNKSGGPFYRLLIRITETDIIRPNIGIRKVSNDEEKNYGYIK